MKSHVRKGDTVRVLSGKDRGKTGKVLSALPEDAKVVVEGVHLVKRATRPSRKVRQAGIITKPAPIPAAKVMLICPACAKPTKIRRETRTGLGRVRLCRRCGQIVDQERGASR